MGHEVMAAALAAHPRARIVTGGGLHNLAACLAAHPEARIALPGHAMWAACARGAPHAGWTLFPVARMGTPLPSVHSFVRLCAYAPHATAAAAVVVPGRG